jgi:hypothetical protein
MPSRPAAVCSFGYGIGSVEGTGGGCCSAAGSLLSCVPVPVWVDCGCSGSETGRSGSRVVGAVVGGGEGAGGGVTAGRLSAIVGSGFGAGLAGAGGGGCRTRRDDAVEGRDGGGGGGGVLRVTAGGRFVGLRTAGVWLTFSWEEGAGVSSLSRLESACATAVESSPPRREGCLAGVGQDGHRGGAGFGDSSRRRRSARRTA